MHTESFSLRAEDGASLFVRRWLPEGPIRGIVQIAHGMAEHGARYGGFAQRLAEGGWAVYASDHRGHGQTAPSEQELGHFADDDGWRRVTGDLRQVAEHARRQHAGLPFVLFGHSMGSFMTQWLVHRHPQDVDAVILSGSNIGGGALVRAGKQIAKVERLRLGKRGRSALLASMSFGAFNRGFENRTGFEWLSRDPAEVDLYVADPRCGFEVTTQLWIDLLGALEEIGRADWSRLPKTLPILVFSGALDPVSDRGKGIRALVETMRRAGLARVSETLYPEGRHEMLHDTNRSEVEADVLRWLEANVPAR